MLWRLGGGGGGVNVRVVCVRDVCGAFACCLGWLTIALRRLRRVQIKTTSVTGTLLPGLLQRSGGRWHRRDRQLVP